MENLEGQIVSNSNPASIKIGSLEKMTALESNQMQESD